MTVNIIYGDVVISKPYYLNSICVSHTPVFEGFIDGGRGICVLCLLRLGLLPFPATGKQANIGQIMFYDILCILWTSSKQFLLDSELNKMENMLMII